jgi:hypothetical protein
MGQYFQVNGDYNIKAKDTGTITLQAGTVKVVANLTVTGTTTFVTSTNLDIADRIITLNKGELSTGVTNRYSGIEIDRGSSSRAAFVFDETNPTGITGATGTWIIGGGTDPSYGFTDSNLKLRRILTDTGTDSGDLTLIGTSNGVVKVRDDGDADLGTTYFGNITDPNHVPNKYYVDYSILNNPTFQIRAPQSQDTRVIIADREITPNLSSQSGSLAYYNDLGVGIPTTESLVSVIIDNVVSGQFFSNRVLIQDLEFTGTEIANDNTNTNIYIKTNGTGKLQTNYAMQLDNNAVSPAQVSGSHVIYSKAESTGRTGIFYVNTENTRDELVSKNRALLFSMLF